MIENVLKPVLIIIWKLLGGILQVFHCKMFGKSLEMIGNFEKESFMMFLLLLITNMAYVTIIAISIVIIIIFID